MTSASNHPDPLAPELTLAVLDDVLRRAIRLAPERGEGWVEVLMDQLPFDWRGLVWTDVARARPLTPDGRAFLPRAAWEARARRLQAEATSILHLRGALVLADRGPTPDELDDAVRLDPWQAWDLGGMGPYVSGRLQEPEPSRPGWTAPVLLLALGPGWEWGRMLHNWRRLGRYQVRPEFDEGIEYATGPGRRVLNEAELAAALQDLRQRVERMVEGLRVPGERR